MNFKRFLEEEEKKEEEPNFKPWVAKRKDIVDLWKKVRPDIPLSPTPVSIHHRGRRYDQDGIRINGKSKWINSVLGKLKHLLTYENNPTLKLDVQYRQVKRKDRTDEPAFACYLNIIQKKIE